MVVAQRAHHLPPLIEGQGVGRVQPGVVDAGARFVKAFGGVDRIKAVLRVAHVERHVRRRDLGIAVQAAVGFVVQIQPGDSLMADGAGVEGKAEVSLVVEDGVALGQAEIATAQYAVGGTAVVGVIGVHLDPVDRRHRAHADITQGGATGAGAGLGAIRVGGEKPCRGQDREVVSLLPAHLVGQQGTVVKVMLQLPGQRGGLGLLGVQTRVTVPIVAFDAGHAFAIGAAQNRQAAVGGVVVLLIEEIEVGTGRCRQAQGQRGGNAPAVVIDVITVGHLAFMLHQVDAHGAGVGQFLVDVGGHPAVTVGADTG